MYNKLLALSLSPLLISLLINIYNDNKTNNLQAFGNINVDYGQQNPGDPLFVLVDFKPGDCAERQVKVVNSETNAAHLAVKGKTKIDPDNLSEVLSFQITNGFNNLYQKTLASFFADSQSMDGVGLSVINAGEETTYTFQVCFDRQAGNKYQTSSISFDLIFGKIITPTPIELPPICRPLANIIVQKIEGTPGNDFLRGTSASELIVGLSGNDWVWGGAGQDCIIGGNGNDRLYGGAGNDIILGEDGNDRISGGSGKDLIKSGSGNDFIGGGFGDDTIFGGADNDWILGGANNDTIYGQANNDKIIGGTGNDFLDGGTGNDFLIGGPGTDTCLAQEFSLSCEY